MHTKLFGTYVGSILTTYLFAGAVNLRNLVVHSTFTVGGLDTK